MVLSTLRRSPADWIYILLTACSRKKPEEIDEKVRYSVYVLVDLLSRVNKEVTLLLPLTDILSKLSELGPESGLTQLIVVNRRLLKHVKHEPDQPPTIEMPQDQLVGLYLRDD